MADSQSSSSAEVEGFVAPPVSAQTIHFAPIPDPQVQSSSSDKSSRWSARDDVLLCDALITQKSQGKNKGAAIFTVDAWNAVNEQMRGTELISGGAQKTVAQCKARWQRLKIEYRIVKHLRQQPGFSWNPETSVVTALAATWDAYVTDHRDAQPWRKKSFPAYDRVAYLVEDEHGHDAGEEGFKKRWNSSLPQPELHPEETPKSAPLEQAPSTSVFSVAGASDGPQVMPFEPQIPGVSMTMGPTGTGVIHQYRLSTPQSNGKRRKSQTDDQQNGTKRPKSVSTEPPSAPQVHYNTFSGTPAPQIPPFSPPVPATAPIPYTLPPGPMAPPLPPPPPPQFVNRLVIAIQVVEESEGLSEADFVKAVQLFQRRIESAEAYLAIQSKRARSLYLRAEIEDFSRS